MDESIIFMKTPKGTEEIANRSGALSLMVRRVLIMADGQRPVRDLASWVRAGEIDGVMQLLESQGYVQRVDPSTIRIPPAASPIPVPPPPSVGNLSPVATPAPMPAPAPARAPTFAPGMATSPSVPAQVPAQNPALANASTDDRIQQNFEETRRRALREISDRLGPDGDHLVQKIERSRNNEELRELVREAERLIAVFYKEVAAQDFIRALRRR